MFAKLATALFALSALATGAIAGPVQARTSTPISFNNWGGISSMNGFDNFFGSGNFVNKQFTQTIVEQNELVCHSQSIEIVQQRLLIIQEMAKRIITEQICEVETQTIVFQQFSSNLGLFGDDLSRHSNHQVGYDRGIANHFGSICNADGSLTTNDLGFSGHDLGSNTVVAVGDNWNSASSPASVQNALSACNAAILGSPQ
ncbi:hypothetical protein BDN72DRAFT_904152 [Pluteus cervinus]|uniref:Uncharacterized protein n=1 Tax=Pluteus cervinus TaxID=181527 RepID=A0ACD3A6T4_9AGAR|nr:hypothetical protein BDN72DRAFT_904152 [Pluteus cervinus]